MPTSSSNNAAEAARQKTHSRHGSAHVLPSPDIGIASVKQNAGQSKTSHGGTDETRKIRYTAFIRLPFRRGDFQDPPQVEWNATRDRALWKLIYQNPTSKDLDWEAISERFGVSLPFLLQQAAWLSERHLEGMRKQMARLGGASGTASPTLAQEGGSGSSSALSSTLAKGIVKEPLRVVTQPGDAGNSAGIPRAVNTPISRTPSTTTVTLSRMSATGSKQPVHRAFRGSSSSQRRPTSLSKPVELSAEDEESVIAPDENSESSAESDDEPPSMARSQAFRRPPIAKKYIQSKSVPEAEDEDDENDENEDDDDEEGDSSSAGYLPFAATSSRSNRNDPAATLRNTPHRPGPTPSAMSKGKAPIKDHHDTHPESSTSSASSAYPQTSHHDRHTSTATTATYTSGGESQPYSSSQRPALPPPGPLSPRQRAQLASLSPRSSRGGGSEDSPMGSSFSDLDVDGSVTQSALEDALLSMQRQGPNTSAGSSMASRMSSLGGKWRKT